jgi:hypothetical protein
MNAIDSHQQFKYEYILGVSLVSFFFVRKENFFCFLVKRSSPFQSGTLQKKNY